MDSTIDKPLFENRKSALLKEQKDGEEKLGILKSPNWSLPEVLSQILERANSACLCYEMGFPDEKRDLLRAITSNRHVDGRNVDLTLKIPFNLVADRFQNTNGVPYWMCLEP